MPVALVTGGAGFIGSHLVEALLERGMAVRVLDNFSTGSRENLAEIADSIELYECDLRDAEAVHSAVAGADAVFHQGALPSVQRSIEHPTGTHAVNVDGTLNVLIAARDAGVRRMIYASSSSVYGEAPGFPRIEDQAVAPISPYAVSKLAAEQYCASFARVYGLETISLRYFNVFGPRQNPESAYAAAIPRFIARMLEGLSPQVFGDGLQTRDFTYVANVIECNLRALDAPSDSATGQVFNCATAQSHTLLDVIEAINDDIEESLEPEFLAPRAGDVRASEASVEKARRQLGFQPAVRLSEGLRETIAYQRSAGHSETAV